MTRLLKYIEIVPKPGGRIYFYFRRRGQRTPLPGAYNSPEFLEAYWALRNQAAPPVEVGQPHHARLRERGRCRVLSSSLAFTKNKPITQQTDRNILEAFRAKHGDKRIG